MTRFTQVLQKFKYTHREKQHFLAKVIRKLHEAYGDLQRQRQGFSFFENRDWQVVIILDGCRFDTFEKIYPEYLEGTLLKKWTLGSCTPEWASRAISRQHLDTVYVTANPFISELYFEKWQKRQPVFAHLEPVWDSGWDEDLKTVKPQTALAQALLLLKKFPDKKMVIHLMQPHYPFIGKTRIARDGWAQVRSIVQGKNAKRNVITPYILYKDGQISREHLLEAYEANLHLVLAEIKKWLHQEAKNLKGKRIFLTADHGNCFGEWGVLEHPKSVYMPGLMQVPWFEIKR